MSEADNAIAIIPGECFRWHAQVQFIESFRTRAAALNCALQHGYNLVVERYEGSSTLFDVLQDHDGSCTSGLDLEPLKPEDDSAAPRHIGWTALMLRTLWHLARGLAALVATLFFRGIVPLSRRAATVTGRGLRKMLPVSRRAATVAAVYLRKMAPLSRRAATVAGVYLRKTVPLSRRATAAVISAFMRQIAPRLRYAAGRCRRMGIEGAFHRAR